MKPTPPSQELDPLLRGLLYVLHDEYAIDQGEMKADRAEFFAWLDDAGWRIAEKQVRNETLDDDENRFDWLSSCVCIWRADKCIWRDDQGDELSDTDRLYLAYGRALQEDGVQLMVRGYVDKDLNTEDWKRLHAYRIFLECSIIGKGFSWPRDPAIGLYEFGPTALRPPLGLQLPNMAWPYADSFYDRPDYSDAPPDYFKCLKPEGLDEFKMMFDAYERGIDEKGRRYALAKPPEIPAHAKVWRMSQIQTSGKPALLIFASSMDCFWARAGAVFEHLYRAYGDAVDILWVEVDVVDWLIYGDTTFNHFKPHAGVEQPGHPASYSDRARMAKKLYMTHPYCTYPCLLDDVGDTSATYFRSDGGSGIAALIDRDGRLAWTSNGKGWGYWYDRRPPQRGCCEQFPWAQAMESAMLDLLDRDGQSDPETFQTEPDRIPKKTKETEKIMYLLSSRIVSIDRERRILHVLGRPSIFSVIGHATDQKIHFNDPHEMTIRVPEHAAILCKNVPVSFDELQPGDVIGGPGFKWVEPLTWEASTLVLSESTCDREPVPNRFVGTTYLFGKLIGIDSDAATLQVELDMNPGRGKAFIENADDSLDLQNSAKRNWDAHKKWLDRGEHPIHLQEVKDTLVYKQGELATLSECELGDTLCVWYDAADAGNDTLPAAAILSSKKQQK